MNTLINQMLSTGSVIKVSHWAVLGQL